MNGLSWVKHLKDIYYFMKDTKYEDILSLNVCTPFTRAETIDNAIKVYQEKKLLSLKPTYETHEIVLDRDMRPLNSDADQLNSKMRKPLYLLANNFYIFNLQRFWDTGGKLFPAYRKDDPYCYPISYTESLDIDTEEQFKIVQAIYNNH